VRLFKIAVLQNGWDQCGAAALLIKAATPQTARKKGERYLQQQQLPGLLAEEVTEWTEDVYYDQGSNY
jgi:hypothetical protein